MTYLGINISAELNKLFCVNFLPLNRKKGAWEWDKLISRFIWQGQKPRIMVPRLQLAKDVGGFALPFQKDYYIAAGWSGVSEKLSKSEGAAQHELAENYYYYFFFLDFSKSALMRRRH